MKHKYKRRRPKAGDFKWLLPLTPCEKLLIREKTARVSISLINKYLTKMVIQKQENDGKGLPNKQPYYV